MGAAIDIALGRCALAKFIGQALLIRIQILFCDGYLACRLVTVNTGPPERGSTKVMNKRVLIRKRAIKMGNALRCREC